MPIIRKWFISNKDGIEVQITSNEVLQNILNQMTPEELELWKAQYRFAPIENDLNDFLIYTGTLRDLP